MPVGLANVRVADGDLLDLTFDVFAVDVVIDGERLRTEKQDPARKFSKTSLNAKPMATPPTPSAVKARPGVIVGKAMVTAISTPKSQMPTVSNIMTTSIRARRILARFKVRGTVQRTALTTKETKTRNRTDKTSCGRIAQKATP